MHGGRLAQHQRIVLGLAQEKRQGLGQESDAHDVDACVIVFVFRRHGQQKQCLMVGAGHFLQRLVAFLVHAPQIEDDLLHLVGRRRAELGIFACSCNHVHGASPGVVPRWLMVSISLRGLKGLSR
ncbi:hypothetical protein D3C71_1346860 [compost metagenome]